MSKPIIVGISGSLRTSSFNTAVLNSMAEAFSDKLDLRVHTLGEIPLYNQDLEDPAPAAVETLRQAIRDAAGVVISTPEYNHGTSGVLKNALDWASRPYGQSSFSGKPVLIMSVSPAGTGGARAHNGLIDSLTSNAARIIGGPQIAIAAAHEKIKDDKLVDEGTLSFISKRIDDLLAAI